MPRNAPAGIENHIDLLAFSNLAREIQFGG
jgi:hypothetical protein